MSLTRILGSAQNALPGPLTSSLLSGVSLVSGVLGAALLALAALRAYETDGDLSIPLVTLHTTADEVVPYAHELLYLTKVDLLDRGRFVPVPVNRYGHCNFTTNELLGGFLLAINLR